MKANEAPEKIYIPTILAANVVRYKAEGSIEYTRTDVSIEKARKYIVNHFLAPGMDNEITDFVNYMKGE